MNPLRVGGMPVATIAAGSGVQSAIYPSTPLTANARRAVGEQLADSHEKDLENMEASAKSIAKNVNEYDLRPIPALRRGEARRGAAHKDIVIGIWVGLAVMALWALLPLARYLLAGGSFGMVIAELPNALLEQASASVSLLHLRLAAIAGVAFLIMLRRR